MVKEVISSIIEAEERADKIVKEANAKAHEKVYEAANTAENIRSDVRKEIKQLSASEFTQAEKKACERTDFIISEGIKKSEKLKDTAEKNTEEAVKFIMRRLTEDKWL